MNNPELYSQCNSMTRVAAIKCLEEYSQRLHWKENGDSSIDLGCGDGSVTNILKRYIPCEYEHFVASDINEIMLQFAKKHNTDKRTSFRVLDAGGDLPRELKHKFDHVFSFFALHWIRNQEKAFKNIFHLLKQDGGDCLLSILGYTPIYHIFYRLGQTNKWGSTWLNDLDRFLSPYFDMQNIEQKVTDTLAKIGFTDIEVTDKKMSFLLLNGMELKNIIKAVEPYNMPEDVFEEFSRDCTVAAHEIGLLKETCSSLGAYEEKIKYTYSLIVIHARKPRNALRAFSNIYKLLDYGGDCFVMFVVGAPVYKMYHIMEQNENWNSLVTDVDQYISPYYHLQEPIKELKTIMESVGFINIEAECKELAYVYENIDIAEKSLKAICPFNIPPHLAMAFMNDYMAAARACGMMYTPGEGQPETIKIDYRLLIAYAQKPHQHIHNGKQ